MSEKIKKSWPAVRACADVELEECGKIKIKAGQCCAFPEVVHTIVKVKYPALKTCAPLVKEGLSNKEVALEKGSYEIFGAKKEEPKPEPESPDENPGIDDSEGQEEGLGDSEDDKEDSDSDDQGPDEGQEEGLPTESVLMQKSKAELLFMAQNRDLEVSDDNTKKEIVAALLAK